MFKKQLFLAAAFVLSASFASATIVIRGKAKTVGQGGGVTTIDCKGKKGTCVTISNLESGRMEAVVEEENGPVKYAITSYSQSDMGGDVVRVILKD